MKRFLIILATLIFISGCSLQKHSNTKEDTNILTTNSNEFQKMVNFPSNHRNFPEKILENDIFLYNYNNSTYLMGHESIKKLNNIKGVLISDNSVYGYVLKNGKRTNMIAKYDISSGIVSELLNLTNYKLVNIISCKNNSLLFETNNNGTIKFMQYNLFDKTTTSLDFKFLKDYKNSNIVCLDFCLNNYVITFTYHDDRTTDIKTVLANKNGEILKTLNPNGGDQKYANILKLSASDNGKYFYYSLGQTPDNLYVYNIETNKSTMIVKHNLLSAAWGLNNSIYFVQFQSNGEKNTYYLNRYDLQS